MLKKTNNKTLSRYNIPLNRRVFGFVILLFASSSAHADDLKDKVSYIDCSVTRIDALGKEPDLKFDLNFRVEYPYKQISKYHTIDNKYRRLCGIGVCTFTDNYITVSTDVKDKKMKLIGSIYINRWMGHYSEQSSYVYDGKVVWDHRISGGCRGGVSKLQTVPKF